MTSQLFSSSTVAYRESTVRKIIGIICILSILASCTSMNKVDGVEKVQLSSVVSEGDKLSVTKRNGDSYYLRVLSVSETELIGTQLAPQDSNVVTMGTSVGSGIIIPLEDIASVEIETIDGAKTTLAIVGGIVLIPFAILGLFLGAATHY